MSAFAVLIIEALVDFIITGGGTLTGYMVANGAVVMPSKAAILAAVIFGAVGAANQVKARVKELPKAVIVALLGGLVAITAGCVSPAYLSADCGPEGFTMVGSVNGFSGLNLTCKGKGTISTQVPPAQK